MTWAGKMSLKSPGTQSQALSSEVTAFTSQTYLPRNTARIKRVVSFKTLTAVKTLNDVVLGTPVLLL